MRKTFIFILVFLLVFHLAALSETNSTMMAEKNVEISGTFTGEAMGMRSIITVKVKLENGNIQDVKVTNQSDTEGIANTALEVIPNKIVEKQSIKLDAATGATMTSIGILNATKDALEKAGVSVKNFQIEPEKIEKKEGATEDYDVVIIGSGASGISAAIKLAQEKDLKVVVLEKLAYPGGSSRVCGGGIWALGGSVLNESVNVDSTADEYISFMEQSGGVKLNRELMKKIHDISAETFDYLYKNGLEVGIERKSLGHPDSKLPVAWSPVNSETKYNMSYGGKGIMDSIFNIAKKNQVELRLNSKVTELLVKDGAVIGVKVETPEYLYNINAKKVVLATGGFTRNLELIKTYAPDMANVFAFTGAGSTGDGINLTKNLDTVIVGEGMMGLTGYNPNFGYYGQEGAISRTHQLYLNKEGKQFGAEKAFYGQTLKLFNDQTDHMAYGFSDQNNKDVEGYEEGVRLGIVSKAETLEDLMKQLDINAGAAIETAQSQGLMSGPFYAMKVRPLFIGSIPGLKVTENTEVVNTQDEVIPNLYAVGELIFGNHFNSYYPSSGTGMGTSLYTGAIAADHIIKVIER